VASHVDCNVESNNNNTVVVENSCSEVSLTSGLGLRNEFNFKSSLLSFVVVSCDVVGWK
jgi:hypothetical protein